MSNTRILDFGWVIGKLTDKGLTLMNPSSADEGVFEPAQSVLVYGVDKLRALRDALNEMFPPGPGDTGH